MAAEAAAEAAANARAQEAARVAAEAAKENELQIVMHNELQAQAQHEERVSSALCEARVPEKKPKLIGVHSVRGGNSAAMVKVRGMSSKARLLVYREAKNAKAAHDAYMDATEVGLATVIVLVISMPCVGCGFRLRTSTACGVEEMQKERRRRIGGSG